ncbi:MULTISPECIES: hypothetical protein [Acinetobacter calcoaceticus/baumannii complex]|uniref:Uncharacterized protein n=1 Tax=Acinetobacter baumannii (strain ACICU) TaxID=405416 RepID=A0A7U3Y0V3_ACIBC|nr:MULTISPECIES: hypothetical protein [Acinetobacter calcoaceticus/baumannii complex]KCZ26018.1 hypothetical protein J812_4494 [Acinetobacter baumannii 25977_9]ACC57457.1 hypothetical protein ACICU_02145 [Acinetobacter baumannii ACICU]EHU1281704.1 hypothetical protein [Acinetobacter baumannii]EHU1366801.1 hypothetical protein [Acinetobacter baumannii]EHU1387050.1 hypothetical protein [Acinetobacter baumannii]
MNIFISGVLDGQILPIEEYKADIFKISNIDTLECTEYMRNVFEKHHLTHVFWIPESLDRKYVYERIAEYLGDK